MADEKTNLSLSVSSDLLQRFKLAARLAHRSQNEEIRHLIRRRVQEFEAETSEAT